MFTGSLPRAHFRPFPHSRNVNVSSWPLAAGSPAPLCPPTTTICFLPTRQFTLSRIPHKRALAVHSGSGFFDLACFGGPPCHSHWQLFLSVLNGVIPYMDGPWLTHYLTRRYLGCFLWTGNCWAQHCRERPCLSVCVWLLEEGGWSLGYPVGARRGGEAWGRMGKTCRQLPLSTASLQRHPACSSEQKVRGWEREE